MIRVGLTGTLGAGKSTVGRLFERWGAERSDADVLAREAVRPGSDALERIRERWGERVLRPDGTLDRSGLRRAVARDPEARRALERIVHPEVQELRRARRREAASRGARVLVEEVPLLYEAGLAGEFDRVVVVDAPEAARRRRVLEAREVEPEEFEAMDAAQMPGEAKRERADFVIWNDADLETLERRAWSVWQTIAGADGDVDGERGGTAGASSDADRPAESPDRVEWTVDLHMHTRASHDCTSDPADVVRTARERGLDRIAITDHDEIHGALEARDRDPELVIVGEEVRTAEGLDLIGLFLEERIPPGAPLVEVADAIRAQGGVVYLPHPFDRYRGSDERFLDTVVDRVDLVEGFNARVHDRSRNRRAVAWARRHGLPLGAGSDAHLLREIGRGRLRLPRFSGPESLLQAARRGTVEGETSGPWVHLGSTWAKLRGLLPF